MGTMKQYYVYQTEITKNRQQLFYAGGGVCLSESENKRQTPRCSNWWTETALGPVPWACPQSLSRPPWKRPPEAETDASAEAPTPQPPCGAERGPVPASRWTVPAADAFGVHIGCPLTSPLHQENFNGELRLICPDSLRIEKRQSLTTTYLTIF